MKIPESQEIWREKDHIVYIDYVTSNNDVVHYSTFPLKNSREYNLQHLVYFLEQFTYDAMLTEKFRNENIIKDIIE